MPQPGIHAALALATRKTFSSKPWFALGLVFGALLPDLDGYAQAFGTIVQKLDADTAEALYHRTLTHSLFFALGLWLVFFIIYLLRRNRNLFNFGSGMALGIALLHIFVDIFAWFDGVGILWPFWSINIWRWLTLPQIVKNLLRAGNFLAIGIYFVYLLSIARRGGTDQSYQPRLRFYTYAQFAVGIVFTVLALTLPAGLYNILDGAFFLFLAYPNAFWVTWRMKETIGMV
jgi:membrane-bound metal-dependent hydrolase YbcI (DUF457 family)